MIPLLLAGAGALLLLKKTPPSAPALAMAPLPPAPPVVRPPWGNLTRLPADLAAPPVGVSAIMQPPTDHDQVFAPDPFPLLLSPPTPATPDGMDMLLREPPAAPVLPRPAEVPWRLTPSGQFDGDLADAGQDARRWAYQNGAHGDTTDPGRFFAVNEFGSFVRNSDHSTAAIF